MWFDEQDGYYDGAPRTYIKTVFLTLVFSLCLAISLTACSDPNRHVVKKPDPGQVIEFQVVFKDDWVVHTKQPENKVYITQTHLVVGDKEFELDKIKYCFKVPNWYEKEYKEIIYAKP
jgi:uncharacterized lipoprotein YehR (DUF1307 family)